VDNAHLLKPCASSRKRHFLYIVTEYVQGQTLRQWLIDHPAPDVETVRSIVEQIARGLQAMHRQEMLHQDLRPENIMIDTVGTAKIIDFGSTRVAGIAEIATVHEQQHIRGTMQYTAPEYFLGYAGSPLSDIYSLGVITYEMLSGGKLPYGASIARATTRAAQQRLSYRSVLDAERVIPAWVDETLRKAVQPNPAKRYGQFSEFLHDLRRPNPAFLRKNRPPLMERNPVLFWQGLALALFIATLLLLFTHPLTTGSAALLTPASESAHPSYPAQQPHQEKRHEET